MPKKKRLNLGPRAAVGCLIFFALPFLALGVGMTVKNYRTLAAHHEMRNWTEVPATITAVALRGKRLTATYAYEINGRRFTSERVIYDESTQDLGGVDRLAYSELKQHADKGQPFRAFVNPRNPDEAVLYRHLPWQALAFFTIFGAAFGAAGVGMLTAVLAGWRGAHQHFTAVAYDEDAAAQAPWTTRSDWAARRVAPKAAAKIAPTVLGAVLVWWAIAIWPLLSILPHHFGRGFDPWLYLTLLFPLIGLVLLVMFLRFAARAWKFGDSVFEMAGETGVLGGQLAGVVRIPVACEARDGFRIRLSALEQIRHGDDTNTFVLWQDEQLIPKPLADPSGRSTAVPVLFALPFDAPESSVRSSIGDVHWELEISAATSGVDYHAIFDVPVFKTEDSRRDFELDRQLAAEFAPPPDSQRVLRDAGVRTEPLANGGTRITVPMARNWASALLVTMVVTAMSGGVWFMLHQDVFLLWPILIGLLSLVFAYVALDLWFYRSTIDASPTGLTVRGGLFGLGPARRITPKEFTRVTSKEFMSAGREVWYTIQVKPRKAKPVTLAKGIRGKLLERAIIDTLETALARS